MEVKEPPKTSLIKLTRSLTLAPKNNKIQQEIKQEQTLQQEIKQEQTLQQEINQEQTNSKLEKMEQRGGESKANLNVFICSMCGSKHRRRRLMTCDDIVCIECVNTNGQICPMCQQGTTV